MIKEKFYSMDKFQKVIAYINRKSGEARLYQIEKVGHDKDL